MSFLRFYEESFIMEFEEILEFESELQDKHTDLLAAKGTFKLLASDERKLKRLRSKLLALDVNVSSIDTALASFKARHNAATLGYRSVIADLYEFVGYDAYNRALDQGHKLACYARGAQLGKKKTGIGTLARGEHKNVAANLYAISLADFKVMVKKKLKLLKKVRAKLSPIRYNTLKTRNEWLILKLELKLLRRACNIASLRMGNRSPITSAGTFDMRVSYVIHNHITMEPPMGDKKFFYSNRPYAEPDPASKPFSRQPLRKLHKKSSEEDLLKSVINGTNGSGYMPRPPNR